MESSSTGFMVGDGLLADVAAAGGQSFPCLRSLPIP